MEVSRLSTSERQHSLERRVFAGCSKKNCLVCTVHFAELVFGKFQYDTGVVLWRCQDRKSQRDGILWEGECVVDVL